MSAFNGTHGTSASRASNIMFNGFQPTLTGRAGKGVYFWNYYSHPHNAKQLAIAWHEAQHRRNTYKGETSPNCAVIYGSYDVDDSDVLDCTGAVQEEITEILRTTVKKEDAYNEVDIHSAYEYVISAIEKKRGAAVILVKAAVPLPSKMSFKEKVVVGNPEVIVIRDRFNKIVIGKVEVI